MKCVVFNNSPTNQELLSLLRTEINSTQTGAACGAEIILIALVYIDCDIDYYAIPWLQDFFKKFGNKQVQKKSLKAYFRTLLAPDEGDPICELIGYSVILGYRVAERLKHAVSSLQKTFSQPLFELLPKEVEQKIIAVDHASATDILRNRLVCSSWNTMIEHTFKTLQSVLSLFPQFKLVEVNSGGFGTVQNVLQRGFELAYTTFHLANVMVGFLPFNAICESFCIGTELTTRICSCLSQKTNNRNLLEFLSNPPVNENSSGWIVIRSTETRMYCQQNLLFATAIIDVEYDLKKMLMANTSLIHICWHQAKIPLICLKNRA